MMLQPKTMVCSKCSMEKPYPLAFITSFNKSKTESVCSDCRKIRRKEGRIKREGKPELKGGWRSPDSEYRKRSCATVRRIQKGKDAN